MLALIDMRLGDVYRRIGKYEKSTAHYTYARETMSLPSLLSLSASDSEVSIIFFISVPSIKIVTLLLHEVPISLQRCADASPREQRILSDLEKSTKRLKVMNVSRSKAGKTNVSSGESDTDASSDDSDNRRAPNRKIELLPRQSKSKHPSKTGKIVDEDDGNDAKSANKGRANGKVKRSTNTHELETEKDLPKKVHNRKPPLSVATNKEVRLVFLFYD